MVGSVGRPVDLSKLNPPQRQAVVHAGGPALVLAGAGSGKTRVITHRIAHLLAQGIPPSAICAVTFTNKAAEEMRERVASLVGGGKAARELTIGTFHALGLTILRAERRALGVPGGFVVYDGSDQLGVLREAQRHVKDMNEDGERRYDLKAVMARISLAKNAFIGPDEFDGSGPDEYDGITAQLYPRYQAALRACAAFDFDDLIVEPVRLLDRDPVARERWASRFRYVMVDEYQDTNRAQLMLVRHLVAQHGNLMVVGDDDQSIYSWRGADPTNILRFEQMFPGATVIKLEQNYRSTRTILAAANAVIANNKDRHGKTLWSNLGDGELIVHAVAATPEDEAKWVAREITTVHADGRRWSDVAVMYRSNIQAKLLEEELRLASVPYVMFGGQQFFERKEVKDVLAYLRVALNPKDDLSVRRVINYPARGLGPTSVEKLVARAAARHASIWTILRELAAAPELPSELEPAPDEDADPFDDDDDDDWQPSSVGWGQPAAPAAATPGGARRKVAGAGASADGDPDFRPAARKAIADFVGVISRLGVALETGTRAVDATRALIEDLHLYDDLRHASPSMTAAKRRIDNVEGILGAIGRQQEKKPGPKALAEFLRQLTLDSDDEEEDRGDKVVLTTLHGSKGLEFPVCFLVGMEEELLPHARTLQPPSNAAGKARRKRGDDDDDEPAPAPELDEHGEPIATTTAEGDHVSDISEERRLAYVGITRAQRKLYLTRACTRVSRGRVIPRTPSRFLLELPEDLFEVRDIAEEARAKVPADEVKNFFSNFALDE